MEPNLQRDFTNSYCVIDFPLLHPRYRMTSSEAYKIIGEFSTLIVPNFEIKENLAIVYYTLAEAYR